MDSKTKKFLTDNPNLSDKVVDFLSTNPRESNIHDERLRELQSKQYLTQGEIMEVEFLLKKKYDITSKTWGI